MKKNGIRCSCGSTAAPEKKMPFNSYFVDGWKCRKCGQVYFDTEQAQKILLLNKLKRHVFRLKLNKVRSNLILRIPKEVSDVLDLKEGSEVEFCLEEKDKMLIRT